MPTGYTFGLVDGSIKTFPEFAKLCMRAFGATIHMRDESMDIEYIPRTPGTYHVEQLEAAKNKLALANSMTDQEIVDLKKKKLTDRKDYLSKKISESKDLAVVLNNMLEKANRYEPPTPDHKGVKDFMVQQITDTIKHNADTSYYDKELAIVERELKRITAANVRNEMIADAELDISYHTKELAEENARCDNSNKWVKQFVDSLT